MDRPPFGRPVPSYDHELWSDRDGHLVNRFEMILDGQYLSWTLPELLQPVYASTKGEAVARFLANFAAWKLGSEP